jgi:F-type H+-transporting ATPase subunit alpha
MDEATNTHTNHIQRIASFLDAITQALAQPRFEIVPREVGVVRQVANGIARVAGLPGVAVDEIVQFPDGLQGIALQMDEHEVCVVLLGESSGLAAGDKATRVDRVIDVPVGVELLGRVISPMGEPLDGRGPINCTQRLPIERPAPPIMARLPVSTPLQTGIKAIDAFIPIGRGQRELIVGDRQTGKSSLAIDTIINQKESGVLCIYCLIGQRASAVAKAVATLADHGAMGHTVVVVSEAHESPGVLFVAPYAATSIAEHLAEKGRDVLVVYDDLSHHARAYREISLLLRRPPGREALPGDIFFLHSRLLERATHLRPEFGGGSLTALPIVETEAQNISAFIPTNLISITDGQIYLSPTLFQQGVLPAIDVGKSVSRVGGRAQLAAYRSVAGSIKLAFAQFEEFEAFARFGTKLDERTEAVIEHGRRIRCCLKQNEHMPMDVKEQILIFLALTAGLFDPVPQERMAEAEATVCTVGRSLPASLTETLARGETMSEETRRALLDRIGVHLQRLRTSS